jgi:hypothetical protein
LHAQLQVNSPVQHWIHSTLVCMLGIVRLTDDSSVWLTACKGFVEVQACIGGGAGQEGANLMKMAALTSALTCASATQTGPEPTSATQPAEPDTQHPGAGAERMQGQVLPAQTSHEFGPAGAVHDQRELQQLLVEAANSAGAVGVVQVQATTDGVPVCFQLPPQVQQQPTVRAGHSPPTEEQPLGVVGEAPAASVILVGLHPPCVTLPEPAALHGADGQHVPPLPPPVVLHIQLSSQESQLVRVMLACAVTGTELVDQDHVVTAGCTSNIRCCCPLIHLCCTVPDDSSDQCSAVCC